MGGNDIGTTNSIFTVITKSPPRKARRDQEPKFNMREAAIFNALSLTTPNYLSGRVFVHACIAKP